MPKPYLYKLFHSYEYTHQALEGITFDNAWCSIDNGTIVIYEGYAWDGCSPKKDVLGLFTIGTPDGRLQEGKPITYYASLVHDALCQFRQDIDISKAQTVEIFRDMLNEAGFGLANIYAYAVDKRGPQNFRK